MPASTTFDLIIRGGDVIDGSGAPARVADVGVRAGRIEHVGDLSAAVAPDELDARGLVVSPGFIDVHTHSDLACFLGSDDEAVKLASVRQGVTTEVIGNCGWTPFPAVPQRRQEILEHVASVFGPAARTFDSVADYRTAMAEQPLPTNLAPLVGHGTIRASVLGLEQVPADAAAVAAMSRSLEQALDEGAFGLSTGLVYPPGVYSDSEELVTLARVVASRGRIYTTHMRNEVDRVLEAVEEGLDVARRTGATVQLSHLKVAGRQQWGTIGDVLERIEQARADGYDVSGDAYPYTAGSTLLRAVLPPWVNAGGVTSMLERLGDSEIRRRIAGEYESGLPGWQNFVAAAGWDGIVVASAAGRTDVEGRSIAELAAEAGEIPADTAARLIVECRGEIVAVLHMMAEEDVRALIGDAHVLIGSDAIPLPGATHPRTAGTFARVLGHYVREQRLSELPSAIRRMTSVPAERFGVGRRGRLEDGYAADIVVFDPDTVLDGAGYTDSLRAPEGVRAVLVAGTAVIRDGADTGHRPGRVLEP
jgi:N-acyl-D-amino-acid deacylase